MALPHVHTDFAVLLKEMFTKIVDIFECACALTTDVEKFIRFAGIGAKSRRWISAAPKIRSTNSYGRALSKRKLFIVMTE